MITYPVD